MVANANPIQKLLLITLSALAIVACGKKEDASQANQQMSPMPVSVLEMKPTSVPISTEVVAQTEGAKEVEVRPRVGGIVFKKLFEEGAAIKTGQPMFLIDPEPYKIALANAQGELMHRNARVEQTTREAARLKELLASQSISQREYDNAASDNAMAKADIMQTQSAIEEAKLNLSYTTVRAPASGMAGRFLFSEGALVEPNTSLLTTISDVSPIWVRFSLSESELASLGGKLSGGNVKKITLVLSNGQSFDEEGKLNFAASTIDPNLGTQQLRAEFKNASHSLLPGQFVRVRISTGSRNGVFLVPQTAVLTGDQGKFVFVADKDASGKTVAGVRPVQDAGWEGNNWVILSGLKAGEQVLVDNLIKVRPGAPVSPHPFGAAPATDKKVEAAKAH